MKNRTLSIIGSLLILVLLATNAQADCTYTQTLEAETFGMGNRLTWITAQEANTKGFIIQKSIDGINFFNVGQIEMAGFSEEDKRYYFLDLDAKKGGTYYRLKQVDKDLSHTFSAVLNVDSKVANSFSVVSISEPNDAGHLELVVNASTNTNVYYSIETSAGDIVYAAKQELKEGINIISVDILKVREYETYAIRLEGNQSDELLTFRNETPKISRNK